MNSDLLIRAGLPLRFPLISLDLPKSYFVVQSSPGFFPIRTLIDLEPCRVNSHLVKVMVGAEDKR